MRVELIMGHVCTGEDVLVNVIMGHVFVQVRVWGGKCGAANVIMEHAFEQVRLWW